MSPFELEKNNKRGHREKLQRASDSLHRERLAEGERVHLTNHRIAWSTNLSDKTSKILKKISKVEVPYANEKTWRSLLLYQIVIEWLHLKGYLNHNKK
jgi:hypothetical protein